MSSVAAQGALALLVDVEPEARPRIDALLRELAPRLEQAFRGTSTVHFARFALLPPPVGRGGEAAGPAKLVFETHYDEPLQAHLADVGRAAGELLARVYNETLDPPGSLDEGTFAAYAHRHFVPTAARFLSHPGLPVLRIQADDDLRRRIDAWLDGPAARALPTELAVVTALREAFASDVAEAAAIPEGRGMMPAWVGQVVFQVLLRIPVTLLAGAIMATAFVLERWVDPRTDPRDPQPLPEGSPRLARLFREEDDGSRVQNGLTHVVAIKQGRARRALLRIVFLVIELYVTLVARYQGRLGGITSIHFARWLYTGDDRLLFMSNYDGSWESYLGDFVDKVSEWLNAVWAHTCGYPETTALVRGGAAREEPFKQWARACQVPTPFFFCAYPRLSVRNILDNARVRELLGRPLTPELALTLARLL